MGATKYRLLPIGLFGLLGSCASPRPQPQQSAPEKEATAVIPKKALRKSCSVPEATAFYKEGMQLQKKDHSKPAAEQFLSCLKKDPSCSACQYELGWAYWNLEDWKKTVASWEGLPVGHPFQEDLTQWLPTARERHAAEAGIRKKGVVRPKLGVASKSVKDPRHPSNLRVSLKLVHRIQSYNKTPKHKGDEYDVEIHSPKSVHAGRNRIYVNSLEAGKTLAYDTRTFKKKGSVLHEFTTENSALFKETTLFDYKFDKDLAPRANTFFGKPVESELSHGGRYLWTPYYRRDFDPNGTMPSAVAIIDTLKMEIARVMPVGPISKYVKASPNGKWMAVSHWGDNTLGLIDISSPKPENFKAVAHLTIDLRPDLSDVTEDRDAQCGLCLRGMAYSKDSRYLFLARMGGPGGLAIIDMEAEAGPRYLGSVYGMKPKPRDVQTSKDGQWLYLSATKSGFISRIRIDQLVSDFLRLKPADPPPTLAEKSEPSNGRDPAGSKKRAKNTVPDDEDEDEDPYAAFPMTKIEGWESVKVGLGPRSIRFSPDGQILYVALNIESEVVAVDVGTWRVVARIPSDSYPVGLEVSEDGKQVWVTAQGRSSAGGNSVDVFQVKVSGLKARLKAQRALARKKSKKPKISRRASAKYAAVTAPRAIVR